MVRAGRTLSTKQDPLGLTNQLFLGPLVLRRGLAGSWKSDISSAPENGNMGSIWSDNFSAETSLDNFADLVLGFTGADGPLRVTADDGDPWLHKHPILIFVTLSAQLLA